LIEACTAIEQVLSVLHTLKMNDADMILVKAELRNDKNHFASKFPWPVKSAGF
jgi:hypothetical protein